MLINISYILMAFVIKLSKSHIKVKVEQGIILGLREMTIFQEKPYYAFYRIPYAQVPIGELRFKDTKPTKKWSKALDATKEYYGACAQDHIVHKHGMYGYEDCLYLNIYTPYLPKKEKVNLKAVIVWIHGYGFTSSFSHIYGPDFLIDNDVVVVTLTHRISVFGFLKLNETDFHGNMGLKDIVVGLKWIRKNIGQFGGNSKKITLMGSGSASSYISLLLVTKYRKLFSKLILHSGSIYSPSMFQVNSLKEKVKLESQLNQLGFKNISKASAEDIIRASRKLYGKNDIIQYQRPLIPFLPIEEKVWPSSLLAMSADELYNNINNVDFEIPILMGYTSQESITELIPFIHNVRYVKSYLSLFKYSVPFSNNCNLKVDSEPYMEVLYKIKKRYFKEVNEENNIDGLLNYISDLYKYPIYKFIKSRVNKNKTFVYKFDYLGKFNAAKATSLAGSKIKVKGAAQGDELCYILRCNPLWESYVNIKYKDDDRDKLFIKQISQMWANFAKFGEPTPFHNFGNVTWLPISPKRENIFLFSKRSRLSNSKSEQNMYEFWNDIYKKFYAPERCKRLKDEL